MLTKLALECSSRTSSPFFAVIILSMGSQELFSSDPPNLNFPSS
jgi:hypothetical protein